MKRWLVILLLPAAASCGWFSEGPVGSDADSDAPDGLEADWAGECVVDADCDDGEPCNGEERCEGGRCVDGEPPPEGSSCTAALGVEGRCVDGLCIPLTCGNGTVEEGEECDDANGTGGDGCERNCLFSCHDNAECDDANECTTDLCNEGGTGRVCAHEPRAGSCDDGLFCTSGDMCNERGECVGTEDTCTDDIECTDDVCDEESEACSFPVAEGWCLIEGACVEEGTTNPDNECEECASAERSDGWSPKPEGSPCADGYSCTEDACDGEGACLSVPDDESCVVSGEICRPACFPDGETGCGAPPPRLELSCDPPEAGARSTVCRIDLGGLEGQLDCLSCRSEVGVTVVDRTDFGDDLGVCVTNGWTTPETDECCEILGEGCTLSGCGVSCCREEWQMCRWVGEERALHAEGRRCEENRVMKTFDTTGLESIWACFELTSEYAESGDGILIELADDSHDWEQVFCNTGEVQPNVREEFYPYCVDMPAWADDNPALQVRIILHADDVNRADLYLDHFSLRGWVRGCTPTTETVFQEDFTGCPGEILDGWNGWQVRGSAMCSADGSCPAPSTPPGAYADEDWWELERIVDASSLGGEVVACFSVGDRSSGRELIFEFASVETGAQYTMWEQGARLGPPGQCRNICVNLSDIDAVAGRNPQLMIRFLVNSVLPDTPMGYYMLDDISVSGAVFCDGAGIADISPVTDVGGGMYELTVTSTPGTQMDAWLQCTWDSAPDPLENETTVRFTN